MQLNNTGSSLPTTRLPPYALGLHWGMHDYARGVHSLANAKHLAASFTADQDTAAEVIDGYADAPDDSDEPRRVL